ncbi:cell division protein ZapA [Flavobacteriales bacterium]|nr:cell division protein ZapA [Flavobacteriales bacterium]|tara:strand:+ start:253 stop:537 length:285 start_codon:yes stop_codon:yes gene_type:complete
MKQKIKLNIGNRIYPLNVNTEQEEVLRKAAKEINDMITKYEKSYAVKDKQDSLAMCALEIFTNNKKITMDQSKFGSNTDKKLSKIIELIDQNIN